MNHDPRPISMRASAEPPRPRRVIGCGLILALMGFALAAVADLRASVAAGESGVAYATIGGTETLTGKTLTSPTVTTPTITTPAITGIATFSVPPVVTTAKLTTGTAVMTSTGEVRYVVSRFEWTNAHVVALGAALTGDVTVCTLPAKTAVIAAQVIIDTQAAGTTTLTVALGRTSAAYVDYVVASDAKAAANTVYAFAAAGVGLAAGAYDLPSYTASTAVKLHFISTVQNLNAATTCSGHVILVTAQLP